MFALKTLSLKDFSILIHLILPIASYKILTLLLIITTKLQFKTFGGSVLSFEYILLGILNQNTLLSLVELVFFVLYI